MCEHNVHGSLNSNCSVLINLQYMPQCHNRVSIRGMGPGLEIATDTVANATTTFNLATNNSRLVATLATMFL